MLTLPFINSLIDEKYEVLKLIGRGGMSKVYLAMDKRLNKQWAVKEVMKNARDKNNAVIVQSAIAEANLMKKLDHPSLPRIVDILEDRQLIYVVMDYVEGESLDKILNEYGPQPQELVIEWAKQLCDVLAYLHAANPPIIYRDMKPANIILHPSGNIRLLDFGIAREYKEQNLKDTVPLGTKGYAAPEQFGGQGQTDARTDIYGLGVTLYHLLTGQDPSQPPYEIYPIRYWNPALSGGLERIIQKCVQLNPADRYQSCTDLMYALEHYEEYDDIYRNGQKKKLNRFAMVSMASVLCFGVGIGGFSMRAHTDNVDYAYNIQLAEKAVSETERANYYMTAVDIKPENTAAYFGMVNTFKGDASFSMEEDALLKEKVNMNFTRLREAPDYADLAFEIGKLYWYYFDYGKVADGSNQITRMKSAVQWFEDAVDYGDADASYYKMATVYRDIGKFNRDITLDIEEAADKGKYLPYFNNIRELMALIEDDEDESEIVRLELYRLAIYSVETYSHKFRGDGIEESDVQAMYEMAKAGIAEVPAVTEKTMAMKAEAEGRLGAAAEAIKNAYRNGQEAGL
ncbi:serine/threonine protein kinase [Eubacteriales bacterium OttesenSCG-928-M02]|nr:serine/threonine protein kinase [Eubacteriales bacterium OttesenSCG-928-M02]